ncbi:MAG: metal ABC transporter permease [Lewinellaceae bacterium]|nr:metal ABC transporter permease [Phaeodactylibacter sp.]MCB9039417.1 metal ABC transporter permease [Lewinellaceae bacterium]
MELLEILQQEWAVRALIASSMVGLMCGVLGCFIVLRNMSLIGDALSHAILPGVVFAFMIVGYSALGFFVGSVAAGLATAFVITWIQHNVGTKNDAAVGIVFTAMFSVGVMGISWISRNEGVHLDLKDFLFGNVLGVSNQDLVLTTLVAVYVFVSIFVFYRQLFVTTFQPVVAQTMGISIKVIHYFLMLLLSFAVVASLQTVGVILVVAMLITPASTALLLSNRLEWVLVISALLGLASAILGLLAAIVFETTPGPAMAVTATAMYLLAVFFAPEKGVLFKTIQRRRVRRRVQQEDTLKQAYRLQEQGQFSLERLEQQLSQGRRALLANLRMLRQRGWLSRERLELTPEGVQAAKRLVRAHRLWETYLADRIGLNAEQIHDEAEQYEHHLTDEILDEVDRVLGFPAIDPHGSPIPAKPGLPGRPLSRLSISQAGRISHQQASEQVTVRLWEMGLLPGASFSISRKGEAFVEIDLNGKAVKLPGSLAELVNVEEGV